MHLNPEKPRAVTLEEVLPFKDALKDALERFRDKTHEFNEQSPWHALDFGMVISDTDDYDLFGRSGFHAVEALYYRERHFSDKQGIAVIFTGDSMWLRGVKRSKYKHTEFKKDWGSLYHVLDGIYNPPKTEIRDRACFVAPNIKSIEYSEQGLNRLWFEMKKTLLSDCFPSKFSEDFQRYLDRETKAALKKINTEIQALELGSP